MIIFALILLVAWIAIVIFLRQPKFGKAAADERLLRIKNSPNYRDGQFHNEHFTPNLKEGVSYVTVFSKFFFGKSKRLKPDHVLPSKKTDLLALDPNKNVLIWFGHSSYFLQLDGKKLLVDPVFSGSASPVKFTTRSFAGSDVYTTDDIPMLDYLFISHDHWDHLDYETVVKLKPKVRQVITALGVGAHLESWGFDKGIISENDWNEEVMLGDGFTINTAPARHFSGRGLKRNQSLWLSFVLTTPSLKLYLGGDSGYDTHFAGIGEKHGPFDLAILECGQYNEYWKYIHMMPEEVVQASIDLKAKRFMPVHWSKFALSIHDWDEPIIRVMKESQRKNTVIVTPVIGEEVELKK